MRRNPAADYHETATLSPQGEALWDLIGAVRPRLRALAKLVDAWGADSAPRAMRLAAHLVADALGPLVALAKAGEAPAQGRADVLRGLWKRAQTLDAAGKEMARDTEAFSWRAVYGRLPEKDRASAALLLASAGVSAGRSFAYAREQLTEWPPQPHQADEGVLRGGPGASLGLRRIARALAALGNHGGSAALLWDLSWALPGAAPPHDNGNPY